MKRWLSATFALSTVLGIIGISLFTLFHLQFGSLNAAASPVASKPSLSTSTVVTDGSFVDAASYFSSKGITLSISPRTAFSWATWRTYTSFEQPNVSLAAQELKTELSKYSNDALKASGLKSIYLVNGLTVDGQARSGMPEPQNEHALYFDVSDTYLQSEEGQYMRRTFQHEFSHLIEYDLFGSYAPNDDAWMRCNSPGTTYGNGGSSMYNDPDFAHKMHPSDAFIDGYATSAPEEDKAEMFAYFMTDPSYVRTLANKDAGVACKLDLTEKLLQKL